MKRYILLGVLIFAIVAISFAPAGIIPRLLSTNPDLDMVDARGTLWRGQGQLIAAGGFQIGTIHWDFKPTSLLTAMPEYAWQLDNPSIKLSGTAASRGQVLYIDALGDLETHLVNDFIQRYDMRIEGHFNIDLNDVVAQLDNQQLKAGRGEVHWTGGGVTYQLSGRLYQATLPPMVAYLETLTPEQGTDSALVMAQPSPPRVQMVVFAQGNETPLMFSHQTNGGFVKVGITKLFTKLLNNPWPGSDPDQAIVLEVEERLL